MAHEFESLPGEGEVEQKKVVKEEPKPDEEKAQADQGGAQLLFLRRLTPPVPVEIARRTARSRL